MHTTGHGIFIRSILLTLTTLLIAACGGGDLDDIGKKESNNENPDNYSGKVIIDMVAEPTINYDNSNGTTNIVVQFIPRTEKNFPLSPDQIDVEIVRHFCRGASKFPFFISSFLFPGQ